MKILTALSFAAFAQPAVAAEPAGHVFRSAAEIDAMIDEAHKTGKGPAEALLSLAPYQIRMEYRTTTMPAALHTDRAELFHVLDGGGTLVTGGELADREPRDDRNFGGSGIEGGTSRRVAKGDVFIVPEGMPHWFKDIEGKALVLMSVYVPRGTD